MNSIDKTPNLTFKRAEETIKPFANTINGKKVIIGQDNLYKAEEAILKQFPKVFCERYIDKTSSKKYLRVYRTYKTVISKCLYSIEVIEY